MGTRHLYARYEARLHASQAENLHRVAHPAHPVLPSGAIRLSRIDPFEESPVPHLHVEMDVVDTGGFFALHLFFRPPIVLGGYSWFLPALFDGAYVLLIKFRFGFSVQRLGDRAPAKNEAVSTAANLAGVAGDLLTYTHNIFH